jgi:epsin
MLDKIKNKAGIKPKDPFEAKLQESTSNENWGWPTSTLIEIAESTMSLDGHRKVMNHIWEKINSKSKEWRRIFKALTLLEHILKYGSERAINECRDEV